MDAKQACEILKWIRIQCDSQLKRDIDKIIPFIESLAAKAEAKEIKMIDRNKARECINEHVVVNQKTECWEWKGEMSNKGYGRVWYMGDRFSAHRFSYMAFVGEIPSGKLILHQCDNPKCVNPNHLHPGTYRDNINEAVARNRACKGDLNGLRRHPESIVHGDNHPKSRLTSNQVKEMRLAYNNGVSSKELAQQYGIAQRTAQRALKGETWKRGDPNDFCRLRAGREP